MRNRNIAEYQKPCYIVGGRSYHQENPKRQNNLSVGLHAEILVCVVTKYIIL